jgi:FixJ family two-component response regulator
MVTETPLISIVDDDDANRAAIESLVASFGFATVGFHSAESFLNSNSLSKTRCLILDLQMPKMNGLELQNRLKHLGIDTPIIFITAFAEEADRIRALNAGAIDFLNKSSDLGGRRLINSIRTALYERRQAPTTK